MNKLIIALSVACASACVFADSNAVTPYNDLKTTSLDWFNVNATNLNAPTGCTKSGEGSITVEDDAMVVDSEMGKPVTFTADAATDKEIVTVTIKMAASTVPELPSLTGAKVAFAISGEDTARKYYVWLGGPNWVALEGTPVVDETDYELVVRFDNRDTIKKVQFALKNENSETILKNGTADWSEYGNTAVASQLAVDLVGSGKVAFLTGNQIRIDTEVVVDPEAGNLNIPEADAKAFGKDVATILQQDASEYGFPANKFKVSTAYALGLIKNVDGTMTKVADGVKVKAVATAQVTDKIPVAFVDAITPQGDAKISYQLQGKGAADAKWTNVGDPQDSIEKIAIPVENLGTMNYFKVVTTVGVSNEDNL